jgi:hypothetical protein
MKKVIRYFPGIQLELNEQQFIIKKYNEVDYWDLKDSLFCTVIASSIFGKIFESMMKEMCKRD